MKPRTIGKLCAALILGILLSLLVQHDYTRRAQIPREDYLAKQAARYDRQIARPTPFAFTFIFSLVLAGVVFGTYELVGFGISKVAGMTDNQEGVS